MKSFYQYQQNNRDLNNEMKYQTSESDFLKSKLAFSNSEITQESFNSMKINYSLNYADTDFKQNIQDIQKEIQNAENQLSDLINFQKAESEKTIEEIKTNYNDILNYEKSLSKNESKITNRINKIKEKKEKWEKEGGAIIPSKKESLSITKEDFHNRQDSIHSANSSMMFSQAPQKRSRIPQLAAPKNANITPQKSGAAKYRSNTLLTNTAPRNILESLPPGKF